MSDAFSAPFDAIETGLRLRTRGRTVTEADVVGFSNLTWDHHPIHTDAVAASEGLFGERVAHGMLIISYALALLPLDPRHVRALRRLDAVTFRRPVRLGDTIRVEATVSRTRELDDTLGIVRLRMHVLTQDDAIAVTADIDALWAREPSAVEVAG